LVRAAKIEVSLDVAVAEQVEYEAAQLGEEGLSEGSKTDDSVVTVLIV
jgi:hypothetical protein